MPLELYIIHGRYFPEENLDDWGFNGPVLKGVIGIHQTYRDRVKIVFVDEESTKEAKLKTGWDEWDERMLEMRWHEDLVHVVHQHGAEYYGDWGLREET